MRPRIARFLVRGRFHIAAPGYSLGELSERFARFRPKEVRSPIKSGGSFRTFNQEVFEKVFALAAVEWTAAAKARHFARSRRPCRIFKSNNLVLCRADWAMEQRCDRLGHAERICTQRGQEEAPVLRVRPEVMTFVNLI